VCLAGFLLLLLTWSNIAGEADVALQLPYLVSGGLTGLGLIIVGVLVVNISVKRQDAAERRRQQEQLAELITDLTWTLERLDGPR
jgi:hypothetical protein